jgi:hypothetical protein
MGDAVSAELPVRRAVGEVAKKDDVRGFMFRVRMADGNDFSVRCDEHR